jgi:aldose 1-epimerase
MVAVRLAAGPARAVVDDTAGGRITSLRIADSEVLASNGSSVVEHGSFVMAPWAGRIRDGELHVDGRTYLLPTDRTHPHAGHGLVMDRPWRVLEADDGCARLRCDLDSRWPFTGHVIQDIVLRPDGLHQRVEVHAEDHPFPVTIGWHPWFPRNIGRGAAAELAFDAGAMLLRDREGIPDGTLVPVPPGPWDDCFTGVRWPVRITWPGRLELNITSDTDYLVVYDEQPGAFCVEPQSGPPDGPNTAPVNARPGAPVVANTAWTWRLLV